MVLVNNQSIAVVGIICGYGILLSYVSLPNADAQNATGDAQCVTSSGQLGRCLYIVRCKTREWIKSGHTDICWKENRKAIICCPMEEQSSLQTSSKIPVCGLSYASDSSRRNRRQVHLGGSDDEHDNSTNPGGFVVGGKNARLGQFPWVGFLFADFGSTSSSPICGVSLISLNAALTAAHCFQHGNLNYVVRFGEHTLSNDDDGQPFDVKVKAIKMHENYKTPEIYNDIAVLRLERNVPLTPRVLPICLPPQSQSDSFTGQIGYVAGWGAIEFGGGNADTLQVVDLEVVSNGHCKEKFNTLTIIANVMPHGVTQQILCAGKELNKDSCQSDSGGPLMMYSSSISRWIQIGIVSAGIECGSEYPGLYTRVTEYTDWIEKAME